MSPLEIFDCRAFLVFTKSELFILLSAFNLRGHNLGVNTIKNMFLKGLRIYITYKGICSFWKCDGMYIFAFNLVTFLSTSEVAESMKCLWQ